jgi:hypothetical protein
VYNRSVLPWEIPVLEFTFEAGNVAVLDEYETNDLPYPEPQTEFQRLESAYGADPQSGRSYVSSVFGEASIGVNQLRRAIVEAREAEEASKPKASKKRRVSRKELEADPLMA